MSTSLPIGNESLQYVAQADSTRSRFHSTVTERSIGVTITAILMILTISINSLVISTIMRRKPAVLNTSYMFIVNLCVANCLVGFCSMPWWILLELYVIKDLIIMLGFAMQFFIFVDILGGVASIVSLTAISVVRWVTVSHPLNWTNILTNKRCVIIVSFLWLYSVIVASMKFIHWPKKHSKSCCRNVLYQLHFSGVWIRMHVGKLGILRKKSSFNREYS